jgi:Peptidase family M23
VKNALSIFAVAALLCSPAYAQGFAQEAMQENAAPRFELPVACDPSRECSIQKYMDHDPGPDRMDYACGRLSKDGDTGTDFRLRDYPAMEKGVAVIAAANGVVRAVRDGMEDVSVRDIGGSAIEGREAGNAVGLVHGGGWETQYSHLKKGSVRVKAGDAVQAGDVLGEIGLSGNTEFPHMEFTVRRNGDAVDPFVGLVEFARCEDARAPLWSDAALEKLPYRPVVLLSSGFTSGSASASAARKGEYANFSLNNKAPALVFWADLSGTLKGDREQLTMTAPDGRVLVEADRVLDENNISWFMFAGVKRPGGGWLSGDYRAHYSLMRDGAVLAEKREVVRLPE